MSFFRKVILSSAERSRTAVYLFALGCVLGVTAAKLVLDPLVAGEMPFLLYGVAVILAAWFGGFGPGIFATVLSLLVLDFLFMGTRYRLVIPTGDNIIQAGLFLVEGLFISWSVGLLARVLRERRQSEKKLTDTLAETTKSQQRSAEIGEALMVGSLRQHELTEASDRLNAQLQKEITERKQAQEALREAHELLADKAKHLELLVQQRTAKLQEALGELEAFSYSVAHDLRAPLRAMQGYAQELLKEASNQLSPESLTHLQRIERAAMRLDRLTQEVLTYSQLGRAEIEVEPIDLDKLVREVMEQYPQLLAKAGCAEMIDIRSPLMRVLGHEGFLTQALANLLINACKFVEPGARPKVVVGTEAIGQEGVRLWVEDKGIGIAPEHGDRLFKIFGRIHPDHKYEGTGIGLAIVKKAAERMGGTVGFESEPGKGSRFWVQLRKV